MTTNSSLFFFGSKRTLKNVITGSAGNSVACVCHTCVGVMQEKGLYCQKKTIPTWLCQPGGGSICDSSGQQLVVKSLACPFCGVLWQHIKPQITSYDNNPQHTDKSTKEDLRGRKGRVIVPVKVTLVTCRKTLKHLSIDGHEGRGVKNLQPNVKHQWKNFIILAKVDNTSFCGWERNYFFTQMNDVVKHATFICSHCIKDQRFARQREKPSFQRMY